MSKTFPQLYLACDGITNEQNIGGNTKEEVGGLFHDIVEKVEEVDNSEVVRQEEFENSQQNRNEEFEQTMSQYSELPSKVSELEEKVKDTKEDGYYVCDKNGNIVMKYDEGGFDTASVSEHFLSQISNEDDDVRKTQQKGFFVCDEQGNIVMKYDEGGFDAVKFSDKMIEKISARMDSKDVKYCLSDALNQTAAEYPSPLIDSKGRMYVVYISSPKKIGESFDDIQLAELSVQNLAKVNTYNVASRNPNDAKNSPTSLCSPNILQVDDNTIRVLFKRGAQSSNSSLQYYYRDFSKSAKSFGDEQLVMFKYNESSESQMLNANAILDAYNADGMTIGSGVERNQITGNISQYGDFLFTTINPDGGYPMVLKSANRGAEWIKVGYIPRVMSYESSLVVLGDVFYCLLRNTPNITDNLWKSNDFGKTWTNTGVDISMGNTRPYAVSMLGKLYVMYSDNNQQSGWSIARPWRCTIGIYEYDDVSNKLIPIKHYKDRYGMVEFAAATYNDRMFLMYSNGGLFPQGESAFGGYAQAKDTIYIQEVDNNFNIITNPKN